MSFPPAIPEPARPVQETWPELTCFGCGPANPDGMHLHSYVAEDDEALVAVIEPDASFQVTPEFVYGGTIASMIDCHGVWTAMTFRSPPDERPPDHPPATPAMTGELSVRFERPTPLETPLFLHGTVVETAGRRTRVAVRLGPESGVSATGEVTAIQVETLGTSHRGTAGRHVTG